MKESGVYYLQIRGTAYWYLKVFCEQEIADGGWTVSFWTRNRIKINSYCTTIIIVIPITNNIYPKKTKRKTYYRNIYIYNTITITLIIITILQCTSMHNRFDVVTTLRTIWVLYTSISHNIIIIFSTTSTVSDEMM